MAPTKKVPQKKTTAKAAAKKPAAPRTKKAAVIEAGKDEAVVFSMAGEKAGTVKLPAELFGAKWNADLVHQIVVGMQANARPTVANTKFRGEVRGGGKKPWKQKGTGNARHGSTRSPIWRKGGITHGPRSERDYSVKMNRKQKALALASLLTKKWKDGEIIFVDKLSFAAPKTATAKSALTALAKSANADMLATKRVNAAVIALSGKDQNTEKSFRNIGSVEAVETRNLNPVDLVTKKYLVIENPAASLAVLATRVTK